MASRTIARLFDSYADASAAVRDLEAAGFSHDDVSLVASATADGTDSADGTGAEGATGASTGVGTGATVGTLLGGGAGLLAGIGALAIPGIGPLVAAGWLVAALTGAGVGAAAGGLLGGLTQAGIGEEHAHVYAEGVKRGGNLVTVRTDDTRAAEAESIMGRHNAVDADERAASYRSGGWTGYDQNAGTGMAAGAGAAATGFGSSSNAPDGRPGNPPGTMASRAMDAATGTNVSGTGQRNEAGTHLGGAAGALGAGAASVGAAAMGTGARGTGASGTGMGTTSSAPDGTPENPSGTMASRAVDQVAGTNVSGAHPENEDGTSRNPPGTAAERAADRNLGTNTTPPRRDPTR